jgi:hypothetical protein
MDTATYHGSPLATYRVERRQALDSEAQRAGALHTAWTTAYCRVGYADRCPAEETQAALQLALDAVLGWGIAKLEMAQPFTQGE